MTPEEKEILHRLSSKAQRYQNTVKENKENTDDVLHTDVYAANLYLLRN